MQNISQTNVESGQADDARTLQARLYREIGISAVAAALRFTNQPDPSSRPQAIEPPVVQPRPAEELAA